MDYGITVTLDRPFAAAVEQVRTALAEQGFGVLTEIDVQATLRAKIGAELDDYLILGACNPPLAHRAVQADPRIGVLLPCNVVVRTAEGRTVVEAMNPDVIVQLTGRPELAEVAAEAGTRLRAALASLPAS
ncbi:ABC transporter [Streptomyces tateyamensis]|uniref:ABC transporter n=1 Tax=Streptomyces tateyamensis TaxID=565073 RepID=A0A2V4NHL7_9ACTN|nr:DUF302 domain-containing protein [Streptomyces tateyamensis]PYC84694.1 ABC transporter [Streptomyces tateyamensis]